MDSTITSKKIFKTVTPSIFMMILLSLYTIIDGAFVSNFVGTDALSAVNITYPYINFVIGISVMLGTGGCAIVMKQVGEGNEDDARRNFSLIISFALFISIIVTIISVIFIDNIIFFLGSTEDLYQLCYDYLFYSVLFITPTILKFIVEQFLVSINKSTIALILSIIGGISNVLLDYIFIVKLNLGIMGAALATGICYAVPAFLGLIFFISKRNVLYFCKPSLDYNVIINASYNGSSEMVSQLSNGIITFLFNIIILQYMGTNGVAAISIILYIQFMVLSTFFGYSIGICPTISYLYGKQDHDALKKVISISYKFLTGFSVTIYILIIIFDSFLVSLFVNSSTNVYDITIGALKLFSVEFLLVGVNVFTSNMFTAFSNGKVSVIISLFRSFCEGFNIIIMPIIFAFIGSATLGIWLAIPIAQVISIFITIYFYKKYKSTYKY